MNKFSLRGGGSACSTIKDQRQNTIYPNKGNDVQMIQLFIKNVSQRCENILKWSQKIGLQESKDGIIQEIKWFQLSSQYLNQITRETQMVQENILLVFANLEILLQAILNIIQTQSFLSYHLLKTCNLLSQQIFIYYIYAPNPPMKQEKQKNYQNLLAEIKKYIEFGGQSFYQNSIIYEFEVVKMCINICPNDSTKGQEILINTFKGILESAAKMSPSTELVTALLDGAVYIYQKIKQQNQKKIFQVIFYLEQLKWSIIEKIQNGISINSIRQSLAENHKKLIVQQNQWIIKCSWIKFISEILQYTPIITKEKYEKLKSSYKLNQEWIKLIEQKIINTIDENQNIGIISNADNGEQVGRIFKTQFIVLDQLKNLCLNGYQDIPRFDIFVNEQQQLDVKQLDKQQQFVKILEYIDNLQIPLLSNMYRSFQQNFLEYLQIWHSLQEEELDIFQQQCKVQQEIVLSQQLDSQLQNLTLNGAIINKQLECFLDESQITNYDRQVENINQQLFYSLIHNYFLVIQSVGNNDCNILDNYQEFFNQIPEIEFKLCKQVLDLKKLFRDQINQSDIIDLISIISLLQEKIHKTQQYKMKSIQKIQQYKGILGQFVNNVLNEFRQDLKKQQFAFYFLGQTILATNQKVKVITNSTLQKYYVYYAIISQMILIYEELNDLLSDLNLSDQEIKGFKFFNNSQIVSIFDSAIKSEIQYLSQKEKMEELNFKENQSIEQKLQSMLIELRAQKLFKDRQKELVQNFINQIQVYKVTLMNNLENQSNQDKSYQNLLLESGQSLKQFMENGNQRSDLINILKQRRNCLLQIQQEQKNNQILFNQIQKEIQYTQIVNQEQFYELIDIQKEYFIDQLNQSNQIIINSLVQQEEDYSFSFNQIILQFIGKLEKLSNQINQLLKKFDAEDQQRFSNELIFEISSKLFGIEQIPEYTFNDIIGKFQVIKEKFMRIHIIDYTQIQYLIDENSILISSLPENINTTHQFLVIDKELNQTTGGNLFRDQSRTFHQKLDELIIGDSWRYKEYFYFCCLSTYQVIKNKEIKQYLGKIILLGKFKETDFRIRSTLKNKEYQQQLEQLVNNEWQNSQENIQDSLQKTLNELQSIQLQLQGEERKQQRDNLIQKHKELESQLQQQMRNVNEIGDILGITINFLKDIKKELLLIQSKLDNIIGSIEQMGQDIKFLRGKTPQQLLEIRMEQVLQNKYVQDSYSVYVQILVKEYNFKNKKDNQQSHLFNYDQFQDGEIDEFLTQNEMVSLLIHGPAGSGKSITARKIEEYLWVQYKKQINGQEWNQQSNLQIPIFIQLPILKEPQFTAVEETLLSSIYHFDQKQINQLLDQIQNTKIKLIFIMDSYDELLIQTQGMNLIQTNKLYQWKQKNDIKHPKVISTSRSEIFTNSNYRQWFFENVQIGFKSYKEIKLLPFNQLQIQEFLFSFSQLQLKMQIRDLLEIISKQQSQDRLISDTRQIYDQLQINNNQQKEYLLNQAQIKKLIQIIKQHPNVININQDQEVSFIKHLLTIWSVDQYSQSIQQMELLDILDTPFMLNIVVQVLPQMAEILSSQNYIKDSFKLTYIKEKRNQIQSILNRFRSKNQFILEKYLPQDIDELEKVINDKTNVKIKDEVNQIWNLLIDSNFFKDFNIILQYQEIIKLLQNVGQLSGLINKNKISKERDIDNYLPIYKALTSRKSTIYEFYQFFLDNYIEKQRIKLIYNNDIQEQNQFIIDIQQYGEKLAVAMTLSYVTTVEIKPKGILFKRQEDFSPFDQFFEDQDQYAKYRKLIRKCLPLKQKANFYSFNHKTIQEYLFAKHIVDFIGGIEKNTPQVFGRQIKEFNREYLIEILEKSSLNQVNLGETSMIGAFKFIRTAIQGNLESQEVCYMLSKLSGINPSLVKLSSNAFYILFNVKKIVKQKDFSKINIADISLNGSYFKKCNFSDSKFERVNLNGIHLSKTDLSRTDWTDIYTNDLPIYKADFHVKHMSYSLDGQKIIGGGDEGWIWIWDKYSSELIKKFQCYKKGVYYVKEMQNDKIISLGQDQEIYFIKFWDREFNQLNSQINMVINKKKDDVDINQQFTHNNSYIGTQDNDWINIYDIDSNLVNRWELLQDTQKIQIKNNLDLIYAVSTTNWTITIWDFNKIQQQIIQLPKIKSDLDNQEIKFSDDLKFLLIYHRNGNNFWQFNIKKCQQDDQQDQQLYEHRFEHGINNLTMTPDKQYLACSDYFRLFIYDTNSFFAHSIPIINDSRGITSLVFDSKQAELITTSYDNTIKLWDFKTFFEKSVQSYSEKLEHISGVQYSPDGLQIYFYCAKKKKSLFIVSLETGEQTDQIEFQFKVFKVCISGRYIYLIDARDYFIQYDINNKTYLEILSLQNFGEIDCIEQSQNFRLFCLFDFHGNHKYIVILNDKAQFQYYVNLKSSSIYFSYNTNFLYYISDEDQKTISTKQIQIQETKDNFLKEVAQPKFVHDNKINQFVVKSDDKFIISLSNDTLFVWNIESKGIHLKFNLYKSAFVISKTVNQYLIVFDSKNLTFYETQTYQMVGQQSTYNILSVCCCPNKYQFISRGLDNTLKLWNIDKEKFNERCYVFKEGLVIPNYNMHGTLLDNIKWDDSKILSHSKIDLQNLWQKKLE